MIMQEKNTKLPPPLVEFLNRYEQYGFRDKMAVLRLALRQLQMEKGTGDVGVRGDEGKRAEEVVLPAERTAVWLDKRLVAWFEAQVREEDGGYVEEMEGVLWAHVAKGGRP